MLNRASSKLSEHFPRIAQLVMPEVATDAASGTSAAEGVVTPDVRSVVATSHIGSRRSPIGIPWTVPDVVLWKAWFANKIREAEGQFVLDYSRLKK